VTTTMSAVASKATAAQRSAWARNALDAAAAAAE
jgi:hypothetical protein